MVRAAASAASAPTRIGLALKTHRNNLLVLASFLVLAAALLAPLSIHPASLVIPNEDVYGNAWAMSWVVHQLGRDPVHLYDANIFYPVPKAFAYTEPLLPQAVQAMPLFWLGASPLLAHNLVLLATFPLTAFGAYLLAADLFGSRRGAWIAGVAFGFCAYRLDHLVHVQSVSMQWLPLAMLYARRAWLVGKPRHFVALGAFALAQALSSGYYAVLIAAALMLVVPFCWRAGGPGALARYGGTLALAGALAGIVFLPHRDAMKRESEIRGYNVMRSPEEMIHWSAHWSSYLDPGTRAPLPYQQELNQRFAGGESLYPGIWVLALALVGFAGVRTREKWLAATTGAVGLILSFGPYITTFGWTFQGPLFYVYNLPPFSALRTPSRFGVLTVLALCLLAAAGARVLLRLGAQGRWVVGIITIGVLIDVWPGAHRRAVMRPEQPPPPTTQWLASAPAGPTLELPWDHETMGMGGQYIYWSTRHWQHMVNGWGGWYPTGPFDLGVNAKRFPSPASSRELRRAAIRYVVIHLDLVPAERRARILATADLPPGVALVADLGPHRIYEIDSAGPTERPGRSESSTSEPEAGAADEPR
jgi:hypothetical protein